ncbi:MAG TPA: shikimate kinase [Paludibacter sp.]
MNRIFLIGYMGSGKTTVGKLLAERIGYSFVDMDSHIEEQQFKSVSKIFAERGEDEFRLLEQKCLHEVAQFDDVIISTGGGAPCFFGNMEYMNAHGTTIYLRFTTAELAARLTTQAAKRPLIATKTGDELRQFIADGLAKREPFYTQANYSVEGDINSVVKQIVEIIGA